MEASRSAQLGNPAAQRFGQLRRADGFRPVLHAVISLLRRPPEAASGAGITSA